MVNGEIAMLKSDHTRKLWTRQVWKVQVAWRRFLCTSLWGYHGLRRPVIGLEKKKGLSDGKMGKCTKTNK